MNKEKKFKIAIFHDEFIQFGGAEKVVITLAKELKADIITSRVSNNLKEFIPKDINLILVNDFSKNPTRNLERIFSSINFSNPYDFYIFSKFHTLFSASKHKPNLFYIHEMLYSKKVEVKREYYDTNLFLTLYDKFLNFKKNNFDIKIDRRISFLIKGFLYKLSRFSYISKSRYLFKDIDLIISNSKHTSNLLKEINQLDSIIIYPPINEGSFKFNKSGNYWVSVNNINARKRIDLQIKTFINLPNEKLVIVGGFPDNPYYKKLKNMKPKNVEFVGSLNDKKIINYLSNSKGFITTCYDEAFGMSAVEAMASGKPVIAPNEGGYKETIIDGITGKLIDDINPDKLAKAIQEMNNELKKNPLKYKNPCIKQAKKFDTKIFVEKMKEEINNVLKEYGP